MSGAPATHEPITLLMAERPPLDADAPAAAPAVRAAILRADAPAPRATRRSRHVVRAAVVIAFALVGVLTGVHVLEPSPSGSDGGSRPRIAAISNADAREIARDALADLAGLDDWDAKSTSTFTETAAPHRATVSMSRTSSVRGNVSDLRTFESDFLDGDPHGLERRVVEGRTYNENGTQRMGGIRWLLDVKDLNVDINGDYDFRVNEQAPPDFSALIDQLERERLIDARREGDGGVVVEIRRSASELAPVEGTSLVTHQAEGRVGLDPVTSFAWMFSHGPSDPQITVRIRVDADGAMRSIEAAAPQRALVQNGKRGGQKVTGTLRVEWSWRAPEGDVEAPSPADVMVVGDDVQSRRGATGIAGPHGTLDLFTERELLALRARALAAPLSTYQPARMNRRQPPQRSLAERRAEQRRAADARRRFRAAVEAYQPFDRADLAADAACTPYWVPSLRAMDREIAAANPDAAGWRCTVGSGLGSFSINPGQSKPLEMNFGAPSGVSFSITE